MEQDDDYKRRNFLLVLLVFVLAILSRIWFLFRVKQDMWHDASFTYLYASEPAKFILSSSDVHPYLYTFFIKFFLLFSSNEIYLRLTTLVTFAVFFWLLYNFVKKNYNHFTATFTMLLISFSSTFFFYSLEVRNYMFALVFVVLNLTYFFRMIKNYENKHSWLFVLFTVLMLYTHYFTALVLLVEIIYIFVNYRHKLILFVETLPIITFFSIPLFFYLIGTLPKIEAFWFKDITLWSFLSTISFQFFIPETISSIDVMLLFYIAVYVILYFVFEKDSKDYFFLILFFLPVISVWSLSQFYQIYHHRFFLFCGIGLYIVIAQMLNYFIVKQKNNLMRYTVLLLWFLMIFLFSFSVFNLSDVVPTELAEAQDYMKQNIDHDKQYTFVHNTPFSMTPFRYYFRDWDNVNHVLITNLTKKQRFTAGGSVIKDYMIHKDSSDIDCHDGCYYIQEAGQEKPLGCLTMHEKGGLLVYDCK